MRGRIKPWLDLLSNVAIIATAILWIYVVGTHYVVPSLRSWTQLRPGDSIAGVNEINWGQHKKTLVMAMRVGCQYCTESAPFYRRLAHMAQAGETAAQLVAALPDDPASARAYLASEQISIPSVEIDLNKVGITGTPTLVLVDQRGRVLRKWVGVLSELQQDQVRKAIESSPAKNAGEMAKSPNTSAPGMAAF